MQALFEEAHLRRRRRRRWLAALGAVLLALILAVAGALTWLNRQPGRQEPQGSAVSAAGAADRTSATAVWVDNASRLHVGTIGAGGQVSQRVVGEANAASEPLIAAGRRVYWVDPAGAYVPALGHWSQVVQVLNLRTGRIALAGAGQTVFLSADRRYLLMSQTPTSLAQTPVTGGRPRLFDLPRGWYLPGGDGVADPMTGQGLDTANGVVVQSRESPGVGARRIAVWNPRTGAVQVIGRARAVIDAYTPPGAHYSLLAWLPAVCPPPGSCRIAITNTGERSGHDRQQPGTGRLRGRRRLLAGRRHAGGLRHGPSRESALTPGSRSSTRHRRAAARPSPAFPLGIDYGWADGYPTATASSPTRPQAATS